VRKLDDKKKGTRDEIKHDSDEHVEAKTKTSKTPTKHMIIVLSIKH